MYEAQDQPLKTRKLRRGAHCAAETGDLHDRDNVPMRMGNTSAFMERGRLAGSDEDIADAVGHAEVSFSDELRAPAGGPDVVERQRVIRDALWSCW